jgi:hypothetical protein
VLSGDVRFDHADSRSGMSGQPARETDIAQVRKARALFSMRAAEERIRRSSLSSRVYSGSMGR